jgi:hypothetical protein
VGILDTAFSGGFKILVGRELVGGKLFFVIGNGHRARNFYGRREVSSVPTTARHRDSGVVAAAYAALQLQ